MQKDNKGEITISAHMKDKISTITNGVWKQGKVKNTAWMIVLLLGILGIFIIHFVPPKYSLKEGQISPTTIKASQTITYEDSKKTAERKLMAAESVEDIYVINTQVMTELESGIADNFNEFRDIIKSNKSRKEKIQKLIALFDITELTAGELLEIDADKVVSLKAETFHLLHINWDPGVKEHEVEDKKAELMAQIDLKFKSPDRYIIKSVFNNINLKPNCIFDEAATVRAKKEAEKNEGPVLITIRKGQKIVGEGEIVTVDQIEMLHALGYQRTTSPFKTLGGVAIFLILVIVLTYLFLKRYKGKFIYKKNNLILLTLLVFFMLLITKLISAITISSNPAIAELVGYLIPVAAGSMLFAILLDSKIAIFLTFIVSILVGILTGNQLSYAINAFASGLVGVYSVSRFSQRLDWVKAGLFIASANVVCIFSLSLINNLSWKLVLIAVFLGVLNGFLSVVFAYGSLPFLESGFKVTTSVRLLELSNPNQPLLKRLLIEAPGTYHHSIMAGNLAEAAADAVGADSLLVRVGAYYHDVGKLRRPYFFIENQLGGENPHEKLTPALSTLIITSHVKDGIELADKYGIPPVIKELILQHHGTSLVSYFYHKALELGNADTVKESDFRYDAVKPQTKEAAIIMLADTVEAAVRSMTEITSGKIEGLVRKIIKERLGDGQLDECDLTFKDLDLIASAFTHTLNGIYHSRIEYPESVREVIEGGKLPDEGTDSQQSDQDNSDEEGKGNS